MRVLQVMECTIGGTRRHLRDLVRGLAARGVGVEVACAALREPRMREDMAALREEGIPVHEVPMVRAIRPVTDLCHAWRLMGLVLDRRFDVIHTHSSKAGALGRAVGWLGSGAVRVHTPHTYAASFTGRGQGGEVVGPLGLIMTTERVLGRISHRLIHVSEAEREEGQRLGVIPPGRARVVPNGIDPALYARPRGGAALRREFGIPEDARVVGTVGLLNDAKGHDLLVSALSELPADVHALLVGHGELEEDLRRQAREAGLDGRVHITGWRDDMGACHDAMDIFALPSRWEGLSYALLEAMAAGLPCVSAAVNGSPEALGEGDDAAGRIVPVDDAPALAAALGELLGDADLRARLGAAAPARLAGRFTLDAMVTGTLEVYREALGKGQPR